MREGEAEGIEGNCSTQYQIADEVHFVDTAAPFEAVAVQKEIARDRASFDTCENIGPQSRYRLEVIRAWKARCNSHRSIILGQVEAKTRSEERRVGKEW